MEQETKAITTPIGSKEVILRTWLTGRQRRAINATITDGQKFDQSQMENGIESNVQFDGSVIQKMNDALVEAYIMSLDNNSENILDRLLDMRDKDYEFVMNEIYQINNSEAEVGKK